MPDLSLDLRFLKAALSAAEHGSFRRAGSALGLPQSTISRRVQLLERRLGFPLFVRDRRGVRPTDAGADFLRDAMIGARQLNQAAHLAAAIHRGERGQLRVGILASLAGGFLHDLLRRFHERHSGIRLVLWEGMHDEMLHVLAKGEIDVAFVTGQPRRDGLTAQMLWTESIFAVLPAAHRLASRDAVTWEDLRSEPFIVSRGGPGSEIQDYLISKLSKPGFRPQIDVHDVSRESVLDLVAMAYGVTLTSTSALREDATGIVFRPITGEIDALQSSAVWSSTNANSALRPLLTLAERIARDRRGTGGRSAACMLLTFNPAVWQAATRWLGELGQIPCLSI